MNLTRQVQILDKAVWVSLCTHALGKSIKVGWLVGFCSISTFVGYLMLNLIYTVYIKYDL